MREGRSRSGESPVLFFEDVVAAVAFYRDLGFEVDMDGDDAVAIGHGVRIRLREASHNGNARRERRTGAADAVIEVDRPYRLLRQLCDSRSARIMPHGIFGFGDHEGNAIEVVPTRGVRGVTKRLMWPPAVDALGTAWRARRSDLAEQAYLRSFREFYRQLRVKRDIYYMFWSGGLLHWAMRSLSFVPPDVNVVLIGSAWSAEEQAWVRENIRRPFFHIDLRVDDVTVWEFLFAVNEHNFGWLDVDCLVLNDQLFGELSEIADNSYANGVWWIESGLGFRLARTFLQFVNVEVIRAMRAAGLSVSPNRYSVPPFPRSNRHVPGRRCYGRVADRKLRAQLDKLVPPDSSRRQPVSDLGLFIPGHTSGYFDTTYMYQALARSMGFGAGEVRRLGWNDHIGVDDASDEILHIGQISSAERENIGSLECALIEQLGLRDAERLPSRYRARREAVEAHLARFGITPEVALDRSHDYLVRQLGLSAGAAEAALGPSAAIAEGP